MMQIIFRKSDSLFAGVCHYDAQLDQELYNISQSELGGVPGDYIAVSCDRWPDGNPVTPSLTADMTVAWLPEERFAAKQVTRRAAIAKLSALGLTDAEIESLGNG